MQYEVAIRGGAFVLAFALMALWETWQPRRQPVAPKGLRWRSNLALAFLNLLLLRLAFPAASVGFAVLAEEQGAGLMRMWALPPAIGVVLAVVLLDLAIYFQHLLFHAVPVFWRLHRVHHADPDFDVTTAMRFHPLELLLSAGAKGAAIFALGPPVVAVMLFEVLLNAASIFTHANVRLPATLDRGLRWLIVTPDMHRIHHSLRPEETNSNFGFNLSVWDRLFGTYRKHSSQTLEALEIGVPEIRDPKYTVKLLGLLKTPFV